jgi:dGTPase
MLDRSTFEKRELETLAPYAVFSINSQGREYFEPESELRTAFQRDRDRIIHSRAFRRLKHKTQVFVATEGDHYRTRLTHSLEVAQIARHIARALRLNEDLTETIALAHDLGHTPFGHAGEEALNEMLRDVGGFEHNHHSKKIVEKIEQKYPDFPGLNLSFEVRDGLIKHKTPFDRGKSELFNNPSLEAQVCNIADEIAYNSHDLDDGLTAGLLNIAESEKVTIIAELLEDIRHKFSDLTPQKEHNLLIRNLINTQIMSLMNETELRLKKHKIAVYEDVKESAHDLVNFNSTDRVKIDQLRTFLYENFYKHPVVHTMNEHAHEIIEVLYKYFFNNFDQIEDHELLNDSPRQIIVADYIAGMTDSFAKEKYQQITSS